ncbi:competence type IV pilus assembly protein ComGB [Bacillus benzoevorans]|uniref:Competence protein ComGB n=1 Tax=Bacillus benzoevorans TaxID=1456 RepID=A0A7X0HQ60_9BACI|nr:competence type IV pilus assembly protein ComGB [Bacillus benzoevorans]MBB6444907.1 competence protein ComGB [Bacillus benzoevorans]
MKQRKWTLDEQVKFLSMTGELLTRGYSLAEALNSILYHLPNRHETILIEGIQALKRGESFYQVLQKLGFHHDLIGYVFFAEQHGDLSTAFLAGSRMMEKRVRDTAKLQKLLLYPLFLILTTLFLFIFMEKLLLPRFSSLFVSMNVEKNFFTRVVTAFADSLPFFFSLFFLLLILLVSYYYFRFRKIHPLEQKRRLMKIPFAASFFRLYYTHYFSIQLSYLLCGGLSVNESLSLFEKNVQQPFYSSLATEMKQGLIMGGKLDEIVKQYSFFEKELSMIIHHGQKNGRLDQELVFFSQSCLQRLEDKIDKTMKTIQPALFAMIGLMIVSMYLAVLLPMFHMLDSF